MLPSPFIANTMALAASTTACAFDCFIAYVFANFCSCFLFFQIIPSIFYAPYFSHLVILPALHEH